MEPVNAPNKHSSTDYIDVAMVANSHWGWTRYSQDGQMITASRVEHPTQTAAKAEAVKLNPTVSTINLIKATTDSV